jgi:hypothetical protein
MGIGWAAAAEAPRAKAAANPRAHIPRANRNKNPFIPINQPYRAKSGTLANVASKRLYFVSKSGLKRFCVLPWSTNKRNPAESYRARMNTLVRGAKRQ